MRGRFYSPAWHRFMNSDQGVDPGGLNQFCYVIGTPLMHTDPSGYQDPDAGYQARDKRAFDNAEKESRDHYRGTRDDVLNQWAKEADKRGFFEGFGDPLGGAEKIEDFTDVLGDADLSKMSYNDLCKRYSSMREVSDAMQELGEFGVGTLAGAAAVESMVAKYGTTPTGRPFTKHYATETGPMRNIPGSVVDEAIDSTKGVSIAGGKTVHYDPVNDVTVVTGSGESIVSVHKGPPRKGQF